nr:hypothetical protein Iba_chr08dCG1570 [Ipomoea batatas]
MEPRALLMLLNLPLPSLATTMSALMECRDFQGLEELGELSHHSQVAGEKDFRERRTEGGEEASEALSDGHRVSLHDFEGFQHRVLTKRCRSQFPIPIVGIGGTFDVRVPRMFGFQLLICAIKVELRIVIVQEYYCEWERKPLLIWSAVNGKG